LRVNVRNARYPHHASQQAHEVVPGAGVLSVALGYLRAIRGAVQTIIIGRGVVRKSHSLQVEAVENVRNRFLGCCWRILGRTATFVLA